MSGSCSLRRTQARRRLYLKNAGVPLRGIFEGRRLEQNSMLERLPKPQAILQVYAVIAFMLSAWTIVAFLWKLSAWLLFLNIGEIFTIFSYSMLTNLLESLLVLLLLLMICALLPPRFLRDDFIVRGTILSVGLIGSLMVYLGLNRAFGMGNRVLLLAGPFAVLSLMIFLLSVSSKFRWLRSATNWISDHLTVFLFILVPLFLILSAYVIIRNIV